MKIFIKLICALGLGLFFSCETFVAVEVPEHRISNTTVFEDDQTAESAMIGIYNELFRSNFSGGGRGSITILSGLSADNLQTTITSDLNHMEYAQNELTPPNTYNLNLWSSTYNIIYMTNAVIHGLERSTSVSEGLRQRLLGEGKFVRAFCYYYMVNLFGEVPLVLTTDYTKNEALGVSDVSTIYEQMVDDLGEAIETLPDSYLEGERTRPIRYTAMALLARVHLHLGQWEQAEHFSSTVIEQSGTYELLDQLSNVFLANSDEAIWQISPRGSGSIATQTQEGGLFIISSTPNYLRPVSLTYDLLNTFDAGDARRVQWVSSYGSGETVFYYPFKYKIAYANSGSYDEYSMVMRLAEQYLIRSEARARQNDLQGAISDLDSIRLRSELPSISTIAPSLTQDQLLDAILAERRREMFTEWGHRWIDLKRYGVAEETLSPLKPLWQMDDVLYPIPEEELDRNPILEQNLGY